MRNDFCALILTHGRPDRVFTSRTLEKAGYTGPVFYVIDDEDKAADDYYARYGEKVIMFPKSEIAKTFDDGDNFNDRRAIIYARNAAFEIAKELGYRFFIQLDDDYTAFQYRFDEEGFYGTWDAIDLDWLFSAMCDYLEATPFAAVALAQGGDWIGGGQASNAAAIKTSRKAMNTFVCDTEKPFQFVGRINEDVNTYTSAQRRGLPFLTLRGCMIVQTQTQSNAGGMSDLYADSGTYTKSFYSVMYAPSCVKVSAMGDTRMRLHHAVRWKSAAPKILRQDVKKEAKK